MDSLVSLALLEVQGCLVGKVNLEILMDFLERLVLKVHLEK